MGLIGRFSGEVPWDNIGFEYADGVVTKIILYKNGNVVKTVDLTYTGSDVTQVVINIGLKTEIINLSYADNQLNSVNKSE